MTSHGFGDSGALPNLHAAALPIRFGTPVIGEEEIAEVVQTLRSGWITTGPKTRSFERAFAEYLGMGFALGTNSGTAALHLALETLGVGPGDEVITSPLTWAATANVVEHCGATPVFADVSRYDGNISCSEVEACFTERTKVIVPVHYGGAPADVSALCSIAPAIPIVVDAAHAIETRYSDGASSAGHGATCAAYSFQATKNLTTGEGGMLVTDSEALITQARVRGLHGVITESSTRSAAGGRDARDVVYPGHKYNMMDIQASLGIHQLARITQAHQRRCQIWTRYNSAFADLAGVCIPPASVNPDARGRHGRHLYTLWFDWKLIGLDRSGLVAALAGRGIGVGWHYSPLHLQPYYRDKYGFRHGDFPVAEQIANQTVTLPLSAALSDDDVCRVVDALLSVIAG